MTFKRISSHRDPLRDGQEVGLVEEEVLEPHERALGVDLSALEEDVAVALEVVARRPRPEVEALLEVADEALADHLGGGHAGVVGPGAAAGQLAELALVRHELRGQEA